VTEEAAPEQEPPTKTKKPKSPKKKEKKEKAPKKEKGALPTLIGILLVIGLLVGGAIWMIMFAVQQWRSSSSDETIAAPAVAAAPVEAVASAPAKPDVPEAAPPKIAKPAAVAGTEKAPPAVVAPKPPAAPPAKPTVTPEPTPATPPAKPRTPVKWPSLALQGVIGRGQNGSAIINDQVLAVNETIENVRVVSVGRQNVELEHKGERRSLKVGMTTP